jgi:hypothetical protein
MRKSLLYYLYSKGKKPLYQDANGHIQEGDASLKKPDGQPAHLQSSPEGWRDTLVKYARNILYWGVFRSYTASLKFPKDGAAILHEMRWTYGIEAVCYLGIHMLDRYSLGYTYNPAYLSELNFPKYKRSRKTVTIEALEGGMSKFLKSNEASVYEIPIDLDDDHVNVWMDGMELDFNRTFKAIENQEITGTANYYLGMVEISREGNPADMLFQDILPKQSSPYPNDDWFYSTEKTQTIRIRGTITISFNRTTAFEYRIETNEGATSGFPQYSLVNIAGSPRTAGTVEDFTYDQTITVPAGSRINRKIYGGSTSLVEFTVLDADETIDYIYTHPGSYVKGLYPYHLLEKIIQKMTGGLYGIKSDWLFYMNDIVITSGDALRGIITDNSDPLNLIKGAVIKTSLQDFFKAFNRWSAGLGIEYLLATVDDKLVIEQLPYFFQSSTIVDLGEVSGAEQSEAEDIIFNTIKCGYNKQDYADANGRYEMNQGQQWTTPITKVVRELNLISPYRADAFGIELLRINYDGKKTSDSSSDNDTFFLNVTTTNPTLFFETVQFQAPDQIILPASDRIRNGQLIRVSGTVSNNNDFRISNLVELATGALQATVNPAVINEGPLSVNIDILLQAVFDLYRPVYTSITGIPHPGSAFNTELTPKKSLLANGALIRSVMDLMDGELITFGSADKNSDFSTILAGVTVTEKDNVQIGSLPAQLFKPSYITFKSKVPLSVLDLLKANPYGKVKFSVEDVPFYGYLMDGGVKIGMNEAQTWKVLSAAENDLSKFNNV